MSKSKKEKKEKNRVSSPDPMKDRQPEPEVKVFQKEFGMSFSTKDRGFNMMPEGFQMCEGIFSLLMDRIEEA